jgi:hypothetical protein
MSGVEVGADRLSRAFDEKPCCCREAYSVRGVAGTLDGPGDCR